MNEDPLILYSTDGCHLCEEAEVLLRTAQRANAGLRWQVVDIANDDGLFERYGWSIPVLCKTRDADRDVSDNELPWPFDAHTLREFLAT